MSPLRKAAAAGSLAGAALASVAHHLALQGREYTNSDLFIFPIHLGAILAFLGVVLAIRRWFRSGKTLGQLFKSAPSWVWATAAVYFLAGQSANLALILNPSMLSDPLWRPKLFSVGWALFYGLCFFYYWKVPSSQEDLPDEVEAA